MKKITNLHFAALVLIFSIFSVSCSTEDSTENNGLAANLNGADKEAMRIYFRDTVMKSITYHNLTVHTSELAEKLNGVKLLAAEDRDGFEDHISTKLMDTRFSSVQEAMTMYDKMVQSAEEFHLEFEPFLEDTKLMDSGDIRYAIQDGFEPAPYETGLTPCENECADAADFWFQVAEICLGADLRLVSSPYDVGKAYNAYYNQLTMVIGDLNDCINDCPK